MFTRPTHMSRSMYRFVCQAVIDAQDDVWDQAIVQWNSLPIHKKEIMEKKVQMEFQNFLDIREGLLATINEYQGFILIKSQFADAIRSVEFK